MAAHRREASQYGAGAPVILQAEFTGQIYYDTVASLSYIAKSKTPGDWLLLGSGDMTKAVYDTDTNDIVDKAESLDDGAGNTVSTAEIRNHLDNHPASLFGSEFQFLENNNVSITTSTTFQNKIDFNTSNLPVGNYKVEWAYGWNHDRDRNDFHALLALDNDFTQDNLLMEHRQEPKDSAGNGTNKFVSTATDQLFVSSGFRIINLSGVKNLKLQFRTNHNGDESSIWNAVISIYRVS